MNLLITGFNIFSSFKENSSEIIVNELNNIYSNHERILLTTKVLKTEFDKSSSTIVKLIRDIKPDLVLMLGMANNCGCIRLEKKALNFTNGGLVDNNQSFYKLGEIIKNAPETLHSNMPFDELKDKLTQYHIPCELSIDAGDYVCNHAYFTALHEAKYLDLKTMIGFIHLPELNNGILSKHDILRGVSLIIETIESLESKHIA